MFHKSLFILSPLIASLAFATSPTHLREENDESITQFLQALDSSPYEMMSPERPLMRWSADLSGNKRLLLTPKPQSDEASKKLFQLKSERREKLMEQALSPLSLPRSWDRAEDLVDSIDVNGNPIQFDRNLLALAQYNSVYFREERSPWSGHYWPINEGVIASRFADPQFRQYSKWIDFRRFSLQEKTLNQVVEKVLNGQADVSAIAQLSPSEKYELLIGSEASSPLTRYAWSWGANLRDGNGMVEDWMGICDGWAAASIMLPRARQSVQVRAANYPIEIEFFPADLMALSSYLWSERSPYVKFVGGRCDSKNPSRDPESGRILNEDCFNTNPATWHLAVVHQVAKAERSFIMDVFFDYEVWNQPIVGYQIEYFNPETGQSFANVSDAIVDYAKWSASPISTVSSVRKDIFAKHRDPSRFTHLVGVRMDVTYSNEINPSHNRRHNSDHDSHHVVRLIYDLELNARVENDQLLSAEVVGGEWYSGQHPDFLWQPYAGSRARAPYDNLMKGDWEASSHTIPEAWRAPAISSSERGSPSEVLIRALLDRARHVEN